MTVRTFGAGAVDRDQRLDRSWLAPDARRGISAQGISLLDAPVRRVAGDNVPLPFADALEQQVIPTVDEVISAVRRLVSY